MRVTYVIPGPMSRTPLGSAEVQRRGECLRAWAAPATEVSICDVPTGPASIESAYEEYLSVPAAAEAMLRAEDSGEDAAILGCFGDPGIDAMRELTSRMVVVAPGAAACHLAAMCGESFGIVTVTQSIVNPLKHLVGTMGLSSKLAGISVVETPVLELTRDHQRTLDRMAEAGAQLIRERGADSLILGCMTMAFLDATAVLEERLGVPVVNPAKASLKVAEAMVGCGLRHSKLAYPMPPKLAARKVESPVGLLLT